MKLSEIQDLIKFVAKSGVSEVELQTKDVKIIIKAPTNGKNKHADQPIVVQTVAPVAAPIPIVAAAPPVAVPPPVPGADAKTPESKKDNKGDESKLITVKSPMIGTFYRSPGPDKPQFVNVGDEIKPGKVICIIEAMKLFNEIEADVTGRIVKVLVNDATPVEYDQPLFLVEPL